MGGGSGGEQLPGAQGTSHDDSRARSHHGAHAPPLPKEPGLGGGTGARKGGKDQEESFL